MAREPTDNFEALARALEDERRTQRGTGLAGVTEPPFGIGHNGPPEPIETPLLTYPELRQFGITYSRKHLIYLQREGKFPRARQLSSNRIAWIRAEVMDFLDNLPVARGARPRSDGVAAPPDGSGEPAPSIASGPARGRK